MTENIVSQVRGSISLKTAKTLMDRVEEYARQKGLACVIAVDDAHGNPIAVHVMEDAFLVSYEVATQKAYTSPVTTMPNRQISSVTRPLKISHSRNRNTHISMGSHILFRGGLFRTHPLIIYIKRPKLHAKFILPWLESTSQ